MNSIVKREEDKLNMFRTLKSKQIKIEEHAIQRAHVAEEIPTPECKPPEYKTSCCFSSTIFIVDCV